MQLQRCHYIPPPPPNLNPTCYIASTMCATSKMPLHPTPHPTPIPHVTQHQPCVQLQRCHYIPPPVTQPQSHMLRSINHVCTFKDVITSHPPPPKPNRTCYVASTMCATSKMSLHPTPPPTTCYVASTMCATSKMSLHPTPPPNPNNPTCYVASTMCATSKMSLHPTPPPNPNNPTCYVASTMCATYQNMLNVETVTSLSKTRNQKHVHIHLHVHLHSNDF